MKPGKVPGPVRIKPNKKSDLTDFRRAKRLQDYLNYEATLRSKSPLVRDQLLNGDWRVDGDEEPKE